MNTLSAEQISAVAHEALPHANPLSVEQMGQLVELAIAKHPRTALDIGCGPGAFSLGLAQRAAIQITALDINPYFLARAREAASRKPLMGVVSFEHMQANEYHGEPVDLVACIGSSHALGTPREAVMRAAGNLRPGGSLIFADLVWTMPPPAEFLAFLDISDDLYWHADDSAAVFAAAGLVVTAEVRASSDSWNAYERTILGARQALAHTLTKEQEDTLRLRAENWFEAYERYGQHCLGFAAYVTEPGVT